MGMTGSPARLGLESYEGVLFDWFETGLEGIVWALQVDGTKSYDGLRVIEEGDHLTIIGKKGRVLWQGIIRCDRKTGRIPRLTNTTFKQQTALGYWIHWVQSKRPVSDLVAG